MEKRRILNENDEEITRDEADLDIGYLAPEKILIEHHEAIPFEERQWHYAVTTFYFKDGTKYDVTGEDDPHILDVDSKNGIFDYQKQPDESSDKVVRGIDLKQVTDKEQVDKKDAWDEYEDIYRYVLYTEEELAQKKEREEKQQKNTEFMSTGPDRLDTAEINIDDLLVTVTDMFLTM